MENLQSTLALQTPRHCDKGPGETHQEMTELNARFYCGLRLLLKCGHFHAPSETFHLSFLSL